MSIATDCCICDVCKGEFGYHELARCDDMYVCAGCACSHIQCRDCGDYYKREDYANGACPACREIWINRRVSAIGPNGYSWEEWAEISELAGEIDYGCNFDCAGECDGMRRKEHPWLTDRACCGDCAYEYAYLKSVPVEAVETVKATFDGKDGFWRPDGCALPRKWRSHVCLFFNCAQDNCGDSEVWEAWENFRMLIRGTIRTVDKVRTMLRDAGLLRTEQLVTIGG